MKSDWPVPTWSRGSVSGSQWLRLDLGNLEPKGWKLLERLDGLIAAAAAAQALGPSAPVALWASDTGPLLVIINSAAPTKEFQSLGKLKASRLKLAGQRFFFTGVTSASAEILLQHNSNSVCVCVWCYLS